MKKINTNGITYIEPIIGAANEWYYGIDYEHGDLFEAEELFNEGHRVNGRKLCIVHYPDGEVYTPVPKEEGCYCERPAFCENGIFILNVNFKKAMIQIIRFDCTDHSSKVHAELPLSSVKDCYNLSLQTAPLTLSRQSVGDNALDIIWPEKISLTMGEHDSFFLRDGDRLFFNRWYEEGEGADYKYWEETIITDLTGRVLETLPGDVMLMPNGKLWHIN